MSTQDSPPILDLYAAPRRTLHYRGWATFGCAMLALSELINLVKETTPYVNRFLSPPLYHWTLIRIDAAASLIATLFVCLGILGLWVGALARDSISEWPRAIMAMTGWTAAGIALVLDGMWLILEDPSSGGGGGYLNFLENIYLPLALLRMFFQAAALAFAIAYALQLSVWLGNRPLGGWSLVVLGWSLVATLGAMTLLALELAAFKMNTTAVRVPGVVVFDQCFRIFHWVASALLVGYFGVIALRLRRWREVT